MVQDKMAATQAGLRTALKAGDRVVMYEERQWIEEAELHAGSFTVSGIHDDTIHLEGDRRRFSVRTGEMKRRFFQILPLARIEVPLF